MHQHLIIDGESRSFLSSCQALAIWGASRMGELCYQELNKSGVRITLFVDSDRKKNNSTLLGIPIVSPECFFSNFKATSIIIASQYWNEITRNIFASSKIEELSVFSRPAGSSTARIIHISRESSKAKKFDVCFFQSNFSGSNSYALYKFTKRMYPKLNVVLLNRNELTSSAILDARSSSMHVVTHEHDFLDDTPSVQTYHGFPLKCIGAMSRYQSRGSMDRTREAWRKHRKIFSYSNLYTSLISACFGGFIDQYEVTGMPRNDSFKDTGDALTNLKKVLPQIANFQLIGFYAPTFRRTGFGQINGIPDNSFIPEVSIHEIEEFCIKNKIVLVKKVHPYESNADKYESEVFLSCEDHDFQKHGIDLYECLGSFDFLITDFSSIYFDFLLLDRPIGFLAYDLAEYSENRGILLEDYDAWSPGLKLHCTNEIIKFLDSIINDIDPYKKERHRVRSLVHRFYDTQSSERCISSIKSLMDRGVS